MAPLKCSTSCTWLCICTCICLCICICICTCTCTCTCICICICIMDEHLYTNTNIQRHTRKHTLENIAKVMDNGYS